MGRGWYDGRNWAAGRKEGLCVVMKHTPGSERVAGDNKELERSAWEVRESKNSRIRVFGTDQDSGRSCQSTDLEDFRE